MGTRSTYSYDVDNGSNDRGDDNESTAKSAKRAGANVDGGDHLDENGVGAGVVVATVESRQDGFALIIEGVESIDSVGGASFRDDFGDGTGEGHGASGEDHESNDETHDDR